MSNYKLRALQTHQYAKSIFFNAQNCSESVLEYLRDCCIKAENIYIRARSEN